MPEQPPNFDDVRWMVLILYIAVTDEEFNHDPLNIAVLKVTPHIEKDKVSQVNDSYGEKGADSLGWWSNLTSIERTVYTSAFTAALITLQSCVENNTPKEGAALPDSDEESLVEQLPLGLSS